MRNNRKAVAWIVSQNKEKGLIIQGSGFFINSNGDLATNYHVIKEADWKSITAKLPSGAYYAIKDIVGIDKKEDIAIIRFDAAETPFVRMGDSDQLHYGDEIVVMGTPEGLEGTVSTGVISDPKREIKGLRFIQFTAPVSHGSSGGAMAYEDKGAYHEATLAYQKVIQIKPDNKEAIYELGILYIVQGRRIMQRSLYQD